MELNLRVIIDESKTSVCLGPTLVFPFNRYWIKTSGGIRVNTWTTIEFWSTAQTNIQTSKALLQNWQHFVDPQESQLQNCTKPVVSCRSKGILSFQDFFSSIISPDFTKKKQLGHQYQYRFMYITEKACYISRFLAFEVMIFKTITVCSIIYTASSSGTTICKVNWSHRKNVGQKNNFWFLQWRMINSNALTLLASFSVAGTWNLLKTKT